MEGPGNSFMQPSLATPPPPPSEVKVRTLRSDLAGMARSGGGLPHFENVKVEGLSLQTKLTEEGVRQKGKSDALIIVAIILGVVLFFGLGYFAYTSFFAGSFGAKDPGVSVATPSRDTTGAAPSSAAPAGASATGATASGLVHVSSFKKAADQTLTLQLSSAGTAANSADLATFNQKLAGVLAGASKTASLIEINAVGADGKAVPVSELFAKANNGVLDPQFVSAHFSPDATFFIYRDKAGGFWPGYVLSLKAGENWLFLKDEAAKLESSPNIQNFFLTDMGKPSSAGFVDSSEGGSPVRILSFPAAATPGYFVYGWAKTYLILSASEGGFGDALSRLR